MAVPVQATGDHFMKMISFTLPLRGPFNAGVWMGFSLLPTLWTIVTAFTSPLLRVVIYKIRLNYIEKLMFVKNKLYLINYLILTKY